MLWADKFECKCLLLGSESMLSRERMFLLRLRGTQTKRARALCLAMIDMSEMCDA